MMKVTCVRWNHTGSVLAISGAQRFQDGKEFSAVQFYSTFGQVEAKLTSVWLIVKHW